MSKTISIVFCALFVAKGSISGGSENKSVATCEKPSSDSSEFTKSEIDSSNSPSATKISFSNFGEIENHLSFNKNFFTSIKRGPKSREDLLDFSEFFPDVFLSESGELNKQDVRTILFELANAKIILLPQELFEKNKFSKDCLKIKILGSEKKGVNSGQLFAILYDPICLHEELIGQSHEYRPLFILKETKKGKSELRNLNKLNQSILGNENYSIDFSLNPQGENVKEKIAKITFDEISFKIPFSDRTRYYSLLQTAKGKSFQSHLKTFGDNFQVVSDSEFDRFRSRMMHIFYRIGEASALLHKKYAVTESQKFEYIKETHIHGDFHGQNIFYDDESDDVTLIDNETFAMGLNHPVSGVNDIVDLYLLHTVKTVVHRVTSQIKLNEDLGINDRMWNQLWRNLFRGYLSAYSDLEKSEQCLAFKEFRETFFKQLSHKHIFSRIQDLNDQRRLKRVGHSLRRHIITHIKIKKLFHQLSSEYCD